MTKKAFQDFTLQNNCWGCGPNNEDGLQVKSYWKTDTKDEAVMTFMPETYHKAGPNHILNGGIISTLIDCHSMFTALATAANHQNIPISDEIWYVTGTLKVKFLKPALIDQPVELIAKVIEIKGKKSVISCSVYSNGVETAQGETVAIRVPNEWRDRSSH